MMTSTENIPENSRETTNFSSCRPTNAEHDTPIERNSWESTPPAETRNENRLESQTGPLSPSAIRNPSPPATEDLTRADMVGDEMYSKSWFCRVLLKLIQVRLISFERTHSSQKICFQFVAPEQLHDEIFQKIHIEDQDFLLEHGNQKQELNERFESELCELWDVSMSGDVAQLLIEYQALDLFHVALVECKDKRCIEIVLGILSNLACCKRSIVIDDEEKSIAQRILEHSNLSSTIFSILTSDDYSDCPSLVQLYRLIYTLFARQDTRPTMLEHLPSVFEPMCFILQSCCNKDLLEQCSQLLRVLFDECHLFEQNDQNEVAYLFLTSITTALGTILEKDSTDYDVMLENLFNCLQIYSTYDHCAEMLNDHCQIVMNRIEIVLDRLVHDDIVPIRSVLLLACVSLCNFYINQKGLSVFGKNHLEYFLIIGQSCYKDRQRRQRSRTHSHSSKNEWDESTIPDDENDRVDLNRSTSEDLSTTSYKLVDQLFLEIFFQAMRTDKYNDEDKPTVFLELNHEQRKLFRKLIKHFCDIEQRLDKLLDL